MAEPYTAPHEFTALVCFEGLETTAAITEQLNALGFTVETAKTTEEALPALHSHVCDIVVTAEDFGGSDAFTNAVLSELNSLPQDARRNVFVVVISQSRGSQGDLDAFCLSADLVLNPKDIPRLKALVGQAIARKEEFYRVYHTVEQQIQQEF